MHIDLSLMTVSACALTGIVAWLPDDEPTLAELEAQAEAESAALEAQTLSSSS